MSEVAQTHREVGLVEVGIEISLRTLMQQPDEVKAALEAYIEAIRSGESTLGDKFCRCSQFPLDETVKTFLDMKSSSSSRRLAREIAQHLFESFLAATRNKVATILTH